MKKCLLPAIAIVIAMQGIASAGFVSGIVGSGTSGATSFIAPTPYFLVGPQEGKNLTTLSGAPNLAFVDYEAVNGGSTGTIRLNWTMKNIGTQTFSVVDFFLSPLSLVPDAVTFVTASLLDPASSFSVESLTPDRIRFRGTLAPGESESFILKLDIPDYAGNPSTFRLSATAVPEPGSLALVGIGLGAVVGRRYLRRKKV